MRPSDLGPAYSDNTPCLHLGQGGQAPFEEMTKMRDAPGRHLEVEENEGEYVPDKHLVSWRCEVMVFE